MKQLGLKIELIYGPFILISTIFIFTYTFLEWLLCVHYKVINVSDEITHFWLPFLLPWIPVIIWLRPRLKLLDLSSYRSNPLLLYQMLAIGAMGAVAINTVSYTETKSGKLTVLNNISLVNRDEETKYYNINNFYIDKMHPGVKSVSVTDGKYNENLIFNIYCAVPILDTVSDTSNTYCKGWLGIRYHKMIDNHLSNAEKDTAYKQFAKESQANFDTVNLTKFSYLSRPGNNEDGTYYLQAMQASLRYSADYKNIFIPNQESFESRGDKSLTWCFNFAIIGLVVILIIVFAHGFDEQKLHLFTDGNIPEDKDAKDSMQFLLPRKGYLATILIYINVIIFLLMAFTGSGFMHGETHQFIEWGANYGPLTLKGEWWRLFTCMFLHDGIMHLGMNLVGLFFVSIFIESSIGTGKYIFAYLFTGLLASATSLWWHPNELSVGASGAIMGLFGLFLALITAQVFRKDFGNAMVAYIVISVVLTIGKGIFTNADNAAHIGGFFKWFYTWPYLYSFYKKAIERR